MIPGIDKSGLQELPRISERLSFVYLEYCRIDHNNVRSIQPLSSQTEPDMQPESLPLLFHGAVA